MYTPTLMNNDVDSFFLLSCLSICFVSYFSDTGKLLSNIILIFVSVPGSRNDVAEIKYHRSSPIRIKGRENLN